MKQSSFTVRVLEAADGQFLTQSDPDTPILDRITSTRVYLGVSDSPDAWREITADEAAAIEAARQEALEAERTAAALDPASLPGADALPDTEPTDDDAPGHEAL